MRIAGSVLSKRPSRSAFTSCECMHHLLASQMSSCLSQVLWECGGTLAAPAIAAGVIHKALAFIAPKLVGAPGNMEPMQFTSGMQIVSSCEDAFEAALCNSDWWDLLHIPYFPVDWRCTSAITCGRARQCGDDAGHHPCGHLLAGRGPGCSPDRCALDGGSRRHGSC